MSDNWSQATTSNWVGDSWAGSVCEHCGRPAQGPDRCPHAISNRYPCPRDRMRKDLEQRMRHIGRWAQ